MKNLGSNVRTKLCQIELSLFKLNKIETKNRKKKKKKRRNIKRNIEYRF